MKKLLSIILIMISGIIFSQNVGDYKSTVTGTTASPAAWTTTTNWTVWNGSTWATNGTYPGQTAGTYSVTISTGAVFATPTSPTSISVGNVIVKGDLKIPASFSFTTTKNLILDAGTLEWTAAASVSNILSLPTTNSNLVLRNGGKITLPSPCNSNAILKLGSGAETYSSCNGGGAFATFAQVNTSGGSMKAVPYASKSTISPSENFMLTGSYNGYVGAVSGTNPTYSWSGTGPGGYTYNSTSQNPATPVTLNMVGTYTYSLTVTAVNSGVTISDTQTVQVVVTACNGTTATAMVDNFTGIFHGGALMDVNGRFYVWGQNIVPGTSNSYTEGPYAQVTPGSFNLPKNVYPVKISGGSSGDNSQGIVILGSDDRIYAVGNDNEVLNLTTGQGVSIALPDGVTAASVTSFYAGEKVVALVSGGKAYVRSQVDVNAQADGVNNASDLNQWSVAVKDQNGNVITNFVSVRGDNAGNKNSMIGFTSDNKIYVWGSGIMIPGDLATVNKNLATLVTKMPNFTGNILLVQANLTTQGVSWYFMTSNKELWSVGKNQFFQLGDFSESNGDGVDQPNWVRVQKPTNAAGTTWTDADVVYFSTSEHHNETFNSASVAMITTNGALYGFGTNSDAFLGIDAFNATTTNPSKPKMAHFSLLSNPADPSSTRIDYLFDGLAPERVAKFIEVGGHISFVVKYNNQVCAAGHPKNGSILGTLPDPDQTTDFSQCAGTVSLNSILTVNAVNDNITATAGSTSTSVLANDTDDGVAASSSNVTLTWNSTVTGFTQNANGTITIGSNVLPGTYQFPYTICDISCPTICASAVAYITVTNTCASTAASSYSISATPAYSNTDGSTTKYTASATGLSSSLDIVRNSMVGYNGVAYNSDATVGTAPTAYYNTHTKSIRIQGVTNTTIGNDVMDYTINPTSTTTGYTPQVVLSQFIIQTSTGGNNEGSTYTISWSNGPVGAVATYTDPSVAASQTGNTYYANGAPAGFDWNNREIEGLNNTGIITNGGSFVVYSTQNAITKWNVTFPVGATNIRIQKVTFKGGVNLGPTDTPSDGIDGLYPKYGYKSATQIGESFGEWMTFTVNFVKSVCATDCYKPANTTTGTASNVTHGITALQRAAKDNADNTVWPLKLKGAYTALDAKTKGFVINRMPSAPTTNKGEPVDGSGTAVITAPVKGMAFYDLTNNCISINTDGTRTGWKCFKTPACDQ